MYKTFVNFLLNDKKIFENIKKYDKIIPVPISKKRYKERGYNQSLLIAKEISKQTQYKANIENKQKEKTNLELVNNCLIKTKNIIEQSKLNKEERQNNIQGVYSLQNPQKITNQKILVEGHSKNNKDMLTGRTDTNKVVIFEGPEELIGKIINIKIVSEHKWYLKGEV